MYKIRLDDEKYVKSYAVVYDDKCNENEVLLKEMPAVTTLEELHAYRYTDNTLKLDEERYDALLKRAKTGISKDRLLSEIRSLETELSASDYKIIKSYEQSLVGIECEYNIQKLHEERQKIRDKINSIEEKLKEID